MIMLIYVSLILSVQYMCTLNKDAETYHQTWNLTWPALAWCEWSLAVHSSHHMAYCSCKRRTSSWSFILNRRASRGKRPLGVWKVMPVNDWALWLLRKVHSSRHTNHFVALPFESQDASWLLGSEREQFKSTDMTCSKNRMFFGKPTGPHL